MAITIYALIIFIVLSSLFKLSLWQWWQRLLYSVALGVFAWWSIDIAVLQSKAQIADFLQSTTWLENIAIIVTIDAAIGLAFVFSELSDIPENCFKAALVRRILCYFPCLLMFPVVFFLLTQTLFVAIGVDFSTTAAVFAISVIMLPPFLAEGIRWLLPTATDRLEIYLIITAFVCILGLVATENGKIVYAGKDESVSWDSIILTAGGFAVLFIIGIAYNYLRWRLFRK